MPRRPWETGRVQGVCRLRVPQLSKLAAAGLREKRVAASPFVPLRQKGQLIRPLGH